MAARESRSDCSRAGRRRHPWRLGAPQLTRDRSAQVAEFQRARLLRAAAAVAFEHGYAGLSATAIAARAGVSHKTFYDLFASPEDCFMAVVEGTLAKAVPALVPAYETQPSWPGRLRAALVALLAFLERERDAAGLTLSYLLGHGPSHREPRAQVLEHLRTLVDEGRSQAKPRQELSLLTGELVVGGVLAVIHARLRRAPRQLMALVSELMWMIVLPYLGPAAAARELRRAPPARPALPPASASDPLRHLDMRLTYRTARVLEAIAALPGATNADIREHANVADRGQISKMLARLAHLGLIENVATGQRVSAANAWHLTRAGAELEAAIRRSSATARS
jgi:AcrR family transcriptional regulator/DNA-binding MarR family transcriptional regulator